MDTEMLRCALAMHAAGYLSPAKLTREFVALSREGGAGGALTRFVERGIGSARMAWEAAERALNWRAQSPQHAILTVDDPRYPRLLKHIDDPPPLLFVTGDWAAIQRPALAIVGARAASASARDSAFSLAKNLGVAGFCIASGLARGIDAAAHRGALASPSPTLAVLGNGLIRIYPPENQALADTIQARGALISECPLEAPPLALHFPLRNRIIAGLSVGVVVVEAGLKSGSLITARLALEQGREVFAMPGSIHNPLCKGTHALIRQGATLISEAGEVIQELPHYLTKNCQIDEAVTHDPRTRTEPRELAPDAAQIMAACGYDTVSLDALCARTGLTVGRVSSILLPLVLSGDIRELPGGLFERAGEHDR